MVELLSVTLQQPEFPTTFFDDTVIWVCVELEIFKDDVGNSG